MLYSNTVPFYLRNLNILGFWWPSGSPAISPHRYQETSELIWSSCRFMNSLRGKQAKPYSKCHLLASVLEWLVWNQTYFVALFFYYNLSNFLSFFFSFGDGRVLNILGKCLATKLHYQPLRNFLTVIISEFNFYCCPASVSLWVLILFIWSLPV